MSDRFARILLIILAILVGGFILCVVGLFILPGVSFFGYRYIAKNARPANGVTSEENVSYETFPTGNSLLRTKIESYEIPIYIIFTESTNYSYAYYDNFNGVTNSEIENPSVLITKDTDGATLITINEFHTFIYENDLSERYFKLCIPINIVGNTNAWKTSLTINSEKSPIYFCQDKNVTSVPKFDTISIKTNGKINYEYYVKANTFIYETANSIEISNSKDCVQADNYTLKSTRGSITITKKSGKNMTNDVEITTETSIKNLDLTTVYGNIRLVSCTNLTANTKYGNIEYIKVESETEDAEKPKIYVRGIVDIKSKTGNVTLGKVEGGSKNSIETTSGNISIDFIRDGTAKTQRGSVKINTVRQFSITTTTGRVYVENVTSSINIETTRGNIYLAQKTENPEESGIVINNPTINTHLGKVFASRTKGNINITTVTSNVVLNNIENQDGQTITIYCGGKLTAENLRGNVELDVKKNLDISFYGKFEKGTKTSITLGDECTEANIKAFSVNTNYNNKSESYNDGFRDSEICFYFKAKVVSVCENQNNEYIEVINETSVEYKDDTLPSFTVIGKNAVLKIIFAS